MEASPLCAAAAERGLDGEVCGGDAKLVNDYFSKERLFSEEARKVWVEPDLKPLDF